jgi:peptidoglycan hydrolase-like protein with peptidoglycan-binding domain
MPDHALITRLRAGGIVTPRIAIAEARRAGLPLAYACALLEKESSGGHNVFGHDASIFSGAGEVTRDKYLAYKRLRGKTKMQGVGPAQLTWWELQDAADREGGCWRPEVNMRIGFRHLAALMRQHGEADGARRYNGSGAAAAAYSKDLLSRARRWERILADVPAGNGNGRAHGNGHGGHRHGGDTDPVEARGHGAGRPAADAPGAGRSAGDVTGAGHPARDATGGRHAGAGRRAGDATGGRHAGPGRPGRQNAQSILSPLVRRGDRGEVIARLTRRLTFLGYLDGARDRFDGETERALLAFQRDHRLEVDGVLGPESAAALARAIAHAKAARVEGRAAKVTRTDERSDIALDELIAYGAKLRARLETARASTGSAAVTAELVSEIGATLLRIEGHVAAMAAPTEAAAGMAAGSGAAMAAGTEAVQAAGSTTADAAMAGSAGGGVKATQPASAEAAPAAATRRRKSARAAAAASTSAHAAEGAALVAAEVAGPVAAEVAAAVAAGGANGADVADDRPADGGGATQTTVPLSGAAAQQVGADAVLATVSQLPPAGESDDALAARLEALDAEMDATVRVLIERYEGYEEELARLEPPASRARGGGRFVRDPDDAAGPGAKTRPGGGADRRAGGRGGHTPSRPRKPKPKPKPAQRPKHLGERAYRVAAGLVGVMESGGNNSGAKVTEIIRANGGSGPEPWCGDFVAYCYRLSGSKAVTRNWAAVRLLRGATGVTGTRKPRRGDLVRFTFDHVGMFVRDRGDGTIETIEGNTGASGAVSDSRTGGDGVYRKVRPKSLVKDYLRVHR